MTSLTDSDGNAHEYFGGQKFNEELAKAAANVSTGYKFLPFEVYARGVYSDDAGGAYTDSPSPLLKVFRLGKRISRIMHLSRATP